MDEKNLKTIVLTGGGTAGHCIPCLALLPLLQKKFDKIVYVGSKGGIEKRLAEERGLEYFAVDCVKFERKFTFKNLAIPFTLIKGIRQAKSILARISPSAVFSKGGYVSLPVAIAAAELKIPVAMHESDLSLGLANRIISNFSNVICTGFKTTAENLPKAVFTGNPLRAELSIKQANRAIYAKFGFNGEKRVLLVFGGSQGAEKINTALYGALDELIKIYDVIHVAGKGKLRETKKNGYYGTEYLEDMGSAYAIADVCVCRGGANALAETVALKIPTVSIPLPKGNSRGDQEENAEYYRKRGAIRVIPESELTSVRMVKEIELAYKCRKSIKAKCEQCIPDDPNGKIVREIMRIAE